MRRGIQRCLMSAVCVTWLGCSQRSDAHSADIKREVLRAEDLRSKQERIVAEHRLLDPHGELIPSTTRVAGITVPRGFQPKIVFEHEWHFDGALPLRKVENYFSARLSATVQHPNTTTVEYSQATLKDAKGMTPVSLTVLEVPGRKGWSRIVIREPRPATEQLSAAEIEREIARRNHDLE